MKKQFLLVALILLYNCILLADLTDIYTFYHGSTDYSEITGTAVAGAQGHDVISGPIELGFFFTYGLNTYTQVKISSNGYITLGTAPGSTPDNALASTAFCPVVAALWDDLHTGRVTDGTYPQTSSVQYLLSGNAPNRSFIVQFTNAYWYYDSTTSWVNFQIVLREMGLIQLKYGPHSGTGPGASASASIGINMLPGGPSNFLSVNPATGSASGTLETNNISAFVPANTLYGFSLLNPPAYDLSATSLNGNMIPMVGTPAEYTVTVRNRGTLAQADYAVKLMSGATELASVAGPALQPNNTAQAQLIWTPAAAGSQQIYGKVVLTGDQNVNNNQTPSLGITVMAADAQVITVGDGSQSARLPVDLAYKNSLFETIYQAAEITTGGMITDIAFYNNFVTTDYINKPTKIWLGITAQTDLATGWIPSALLQPVFDGNVLYPTGQNVIVIPLQTPFPYAGGNLVLLANRPWDNQYYNTYDYFRCQTGGENRSRILYSNEIVYDPAAPEELGNLSGQFPQTTFFLSQNGTDPHPQFAITPLAASFEQKIINTVSNLDFYVMNIGSGPAPLIINSITFSGDPCFTLQNLPALPLTLNSWEMATFTVRYSPTAAGTHTGTITVTDNLTRTQHFVEVSGSCFDPQIYTVPYVQNFDGVTIPDLPPDWFKLISPPSQYNDVVTADGDFHSALNCVYFFEGGSDVILIAPPLAPTLNLNDLRVRFWNRGNWGTVEVGVIADPTDAATYTQISAFELTGEWAELTANLSTYTGGGRFIAFKCNLFGMEYYYDHLDDVTIEVAPTHELAAISITGVTLTSVGSPSAYTITLFNCGSEPQNDYTVCLCDSTDLQLASAAGPQIESGLTAQAAVSWTPAVDGPITVYGRVFLAGDPNALNDQTPGLNVTVLPLGTTVITVGDGSEISSNGPVNLSAKSSLFENIYFPGDVAASGSITALAFYNSYYQDLMAMSTKIWLGITGQADLSAGWISSDSLVEVFNGPVDYPAGQNTIIITLDTPFPYFGGNLVMLAQHPLDDVYYHASENYFYCQTAGTDHARYIDSNDVEFDPAAITGGTLTGLFPKTSFCFSALGPDPVFTVSPDSCNFGQKLINTTSNQMFHIMNIGGGTTPLVISDITFSGHPFFTLQNLPILPASLATGQSIAFSVSYLPTAAGSYTAAVTITDNLSETYSYSLNSSSGEASRSQHLVTITATCLDPYIYTIPLVEDFDNLALHTLPPGWSTNVDNTYEICSTIHDLSAHSQPNCIRMFNNNNLWIGPYLTLPPFNYTLPVNTLKLRFWARGSTIPLASAISVGVLDAGNYLQIASFPLTSEWVEYTAEFQTYAGSGQQIVLKHGDTAINQNIYMDNITIDALSDADLAAVSLTGNATPSLGYATGYTVNLFNWGRQAASGYLVKLFREGDLELASLAGPVIAPGCASQAVLSWNPALPDPTYLYAKVIQLGDQNDLNDQTPNLNVAVQPAGNLLITIGKGDQTGRLPVNMYYRRSLFETVYLSSELNYYGLITGLSFYNDFITDLTDMPTNIWLGSASVPDLFADWIPSSSLTQVFSGNVNYPSGEHTITITFNEPYLYQTGNLVLMVERPLDTNFYDFRDVFYCQTVGFYRTRNTNAVLTGYSPPYPPHDHISISGMFPKTSFLVLPGGSGLLTGTVLNIDNDPVQNATLQVNGGLPVSTDSNGHYTLPLLAGTYPVMCSAPNYNTLTQTDVVINANLTTTLNFTLSPTAVIDEIEIPATVLKHNYPNPFSSETAIRFGVKDAQPVRIEVFNAKGQLVRTLLHDRLAKGHYQLAWNGTDNYGKLVASGIYFCRMSAGDYKSVKKMLYMK
jgi:hypothetical protein